MFEGLVDPGCHSLCDRNCDVFISLTSNFTFYNMLLFPWSEKWRVKGLTDLLPSAAVEQHTFFDRMCVYEEGKSQAHIEGDIFVSGRRS